MKLQRTGLTEGTLIYNNWLKSKDLYRKETEDEFIQWLYSSSGWYDRDVPGTYFDIDVDVARKSPLYHRFLTEFHDSLLNSDTIHLMLHGGYHLNGLDHQQEFCSRFAKENYAFWQDPEYLKILIEGKRVLIVSSIAELIVEKYPDLDLVGYTTPQTHFNNGDDRNAFETLDRVMVALPKDFDFALVSFGPYGCFVVDRLARMGKSAATIGSGIYDLFPVGEIPEKYRPKNYQKIEDGRYWIGK